MIPISGATLPPSHTGDGVVVIDVRDPAEQRPTPPGDLIPGVRRIEIESRLLDENDRRAAANRAAFAARGLRALNFVSAPGAGKTTLLSRTLDSLCAAIRCAVLVGDLETANDARRLRRPGVPVAQITTGGSCHLDAAMIARAAAALPLDGTRLLFIENVGNLVCPAAFDLGENRRITLVSCTEGEDKPLKYPPLFSSAHAVVLTKIDIADAVGFDRALARENIRRAAPQAAVFELSAKTGEGFASWLDYLHTLL